MSQHLIPDTPRRVHVTLQSCLAPFRGIYRLVFRILIGGPRALMTCRLRPKDAYLMAMLCVPALLFCATLTVPRMLFSSENQLAYYYWANFMTKDPDCLKLMAVGGLFVILSLAIPASYQKAERPI